MSAMILIADDDPQIRRVVRAALVTHGYECREARTGLEALEMVRMETPQLLLLDINLPEMSGLEVCHAVRLGYNFPVIVLSVRDQDADKVQLLDAGADDYLSKPFSLPELLARVRVALRREASEPAQTAFITEGLEIDFQTRRLVVRGKEVRLTPKELELLRALVNRAGRPVSHQQLLQLVWGAKHGNEVEYLRVFINQLRKKIELDPAQPTYILTEPWVGYRFAMPEAS